MFQSERVSEIPRLIPKRLKDAQNLSGGVESRHASEVREIPRSTSLKQVGSGSSAPPAQKLQPRKEGDASCQVSQKTPTGSNAAPPVQSPSAASKHQRRAPEARGKPKEDEPLPEAPEVEKAVLCALLYHPAEGFSIFERSGRPGFFGAVAREWFTQMRTFYREKGHLNPVLFVQHVLENPSIFQKIGGHQYYIGFQGEYHPVEVIPYYLDELREKYVRRQIITRSFSIAGQARTLDLKTLLSDLSFNAEDLRAAAGGTNGAINFDLDALLAFDVEHDPDCLVGRRFLVRGGSWMIAGPTGCGKSALLIQLGIYWATGTPLFGMNAYRPRRVVIFQAEDDFGDVSEEVQGVFKGIQSTGDLEIEKFTDQIRSNLVIKHARGISGEPFLQMVEEYVGILKPDIVGINPLFSYAGCDLKDAPAIGHFLRDRLFAIGDKHRYCTIVMHHVPKPPRGESGEAENTLYLGFGSVEVQNSFRAVSTITPIKEPPKTWKFDIGKRTLRAGAKTPKGEFTDVIYMTHSKEGICWNQIEEPESEMGKAEDILLQMDFDEPMSTGRIQDKVSTEIGMPRRTFYRFFKQLKKDGKIREIKRGKEKGWVAVSATSAKGASANF